MKLTLHVPCILLIIFLLLSDSLQLKKRKRTKKNRNNGRILIRKTPTKDRQSNMASSQYYTAINDADFMVALVRLYDGYHEYICPGVIIGARYILTRTDALAGITKIETNLGKVIVRGGTEWIQGTSGYDHVIERIKSLPSSYFSYIIIKDDFELYTHQRPISKFYSKLNFFTIHMQFEVFGWEATTHNPAGTETLQTARVRKVDDSKCIEAYNNDMLPYDGYHMCMQYIEAFGCIGGGGAPLFYNNILLGFSVKEYNSCDNPFGVYSHLSYEIDAKGLKEQFGLEEVIDKPKRNNKD